MKSFFSEKRGQKLGCVLYTGAHYTRVNTVVLFPHINICVVTKQMRDKTTRKVKKWPVTLKIYQVEGTVLVPVRIFVNKENTDRLKR